MTDDAVQFETRPVPADAALAAAARSKPGGWVYDIDWDYPPDQRVPPEAIRGSWEVDASGLLTGRYARNARYRAIIRTSRYLKPYMHAGAKTNRNQWIVDIDPRGEALFPAIPEELIRGWWYVDRTGTITDQFRPNSQWVPDPEQ